MISIVICSRSNTLHLDFKTNIKQTIGVPYEIVFINNKDNSYSLFSAYNKGAEEAKYDTLCFVHEDVWFKSQEWGKNILNALQHKEVGVVGLAGATLKTKSPSPWWISNLYSASDVLKFNILQKRSGVLVHELSEEICNDVLTEVAVLDGVFLSCRKDVWQQVKFDDINLKGFHFYDLDFTLSVYSKGFKNFVISNILIEHTSLGTVDDKWLEAALTFHRKWEKHLPILISNFDKKRLNELEYQALVNFIWLCIHNRHLSLIAKIKWWKKTLVYKALTFSNLKLLYYIFKFR